jgi:hypothetical protein
MGGGKAGGMQARHAERRVMVVRAARSEAANRGWIFEVREVRGGEPDRMLGRTTDPEQVWAALRSWMASLDQPETHA